MRTLTCPHPPLPLSLRAVGYRRSPDLLPGSPRTWCCWGWVTGFMVAPQAWLAVSWGAPSHSPTAFTGGKLLLFFYLPSCRRAFIQSETACSSEGHTVSPSCPLPQLAAAFCLPIQPWGPRGQWGLGLAQRGGPALGAWMAKVSWQQCCN